MITEQEAYENTSQVSQKVDEVPPAVIEDMRVKRLLGGGSTIQYTSSVIFTVHHEVK